MSGLCLVPDAQSGWRLLSEGKGRAVSVAAGEDPAAMVGRRSDVVIGLPAAQTTVFSVRLPRTDGSLYESMVLAQVEKRGLPGVEGGGGVDFEPIRMPRGSAGTGAMKDERGVEDGSDFAVTVTLPTPGELLVPTAAGYSTSAALRRLEGGGSRLWREQGRLVFASYDAAGTPVHLQILSGSGRLDGASGREVSLIYLGLSGEPALDSWPEDCLRHLVISFDAEEEGDDERAFAAAAGVTVKRDPLGSAAISGIEWRERLLPLEVARARRRRRNRKSALLVSVVLLAVYLVGISWLWVHSRARQAEIAALQRQVAILAPDVERIQQMERRERTLAPAFEKSWFPIVQLNRITSALPGSGVVLRDFRTTGKEIRVRGQARDVQFANRLVEDLRAIEELADYTWSMPNPRVESNNTASFEIEGKPKDAGIEP